MGAGEPRCRILWPRLVTVLLVHACVTSSLANKEAANADGCNKKKTNDTGGRLMSVAQWNSSEHVFVRPLNGFQEARVKMVLRSTFGNASYNAGSATVLLQEANSTWHDVTMQNTTNDSKHSATVTVDGKEAQFVLNGESTYWTSSFKFGHFELEVSGGCKWSVCPRRAPEIETTTSAPTALTTSSSNNSTGADTTTTGNNITNLTTTTTSDNNNNVSSTAELTTTASTNVITTTTTTTSDNNVSSTAKLTTTASTNVITTTTTTTSERKSKDSSTADTTKSTTKSTTDNITVQAATSIQFSNVGQYTAIAALATAVLFLVGIVAWQCHSARRRQEDETETDDVDVPPPEHKSHKTETCETDDVVVPPPEDETETDDVVVPRQVKGEPTILEIIDIVRPVSTAI